MRERLVEWDVATATRAGQSVCGDRAFVREHDGGALLAIVDGEGHGPEAARAAKVATDLLESFVNRPLDDLMLKIHGALAGTRGAVMLVAAFDATDGTLAWTGVGHVLGILVRADPRMRPRREVLMPREGVAGHLLPPSERSQMRVLDGDLLVLATDGIRGDFVDSAQPGDDPRRVASRILANHYTGHDDALALVARLRVAQP